MSNIIFICEGLSEKNLIEKVLTPYWANKGFGISTDVIILGKNGGDVRYERLKTELDPIFQNDSETYVTTVFDYYELHGVWPGQDTLSSGMTALEKVSKIENKTKDKLISELMSHPIQAKFIPYFMLHEYEGLLFTQPEAITRVTCARGATAALTQILVDFNNKPEEINTDFAPSIRMKNARANYGKTVHAHRIANTIGVDTLRAACPHFDDWMNVLEALR